MEESGKLKGKRKSGFMPDKIKSEKLDDLIHSVSMLFDKVKSAENEKVRDLRKVNHSQLQYEIVLL